MKVMVDIDGTLAINKHYHPMKTKLVEDWDTLIDSIPDDEPINEILDVVDGLYMSGYNEIYFVFQRFFHIMRS